MVSDGAQRDGSGARSSRSGSRATVAGHLSSHKRMRRHSTMGSLREAGFVAQRHEASNALSHASPPVRGKLTSSYRHVIFALIRPAGVSERPFLCRHFPAQGVGNSGANTEHPRVKWVAPEPRALGASWTALRPRSGSEQAPISTNVLAANAGAGGLPSALTISRSFPDSKNRRCPTPRLDGEAHLTSA